MRTKGITTSGMIQLGDGSTIKAGINGSGTLEEEIRIWAGATYANRASAPFRVLQDGKVYATAGAIGGWNLDTNAIYHGTKSTGNGFASSDGFTLSSDGSIHTPRFYVNADGSVGIRSSITGQRVEIDSITNTLKLTAADGDYVLIDDDLWGGWVGIQLKDVLTNTFCELVPFGIKFYEGSHVAGIQLMQNISGLELFGRIKLSNLPQSSSGLGPDELYRDGSGYIRQTA